MYSASPPFINTMRYTVVYSQRENYYTNCTCGWKRANTYLVFSRQCGGVGEVQVESSLRLGCDGGIVPRESIQHTQDCRAQQLVSMALCRKTFVCVISIEGVLLQDGIPSGLASQPTLLKAPTTYFLPNATKLWRVS